MFLSLVDACHAVLSPEGFIETVYPLVQTLLPHDKFICGLATVQPASVVDVVNLGFPEGYMNWQVAGDGAILSPMIRSWLDQKVPGPVFFDTERDIDLLRCDADWAWYEALRQAGIRTLMAHGMRDVGRSAMSYFCLSGATQDQQTLCSTMKLIVPHLHIAVMQFHFQRQPRDIICPLSTRETDVLELICRGKTNPEIADILGISAWTVKIHVRNFMSKLDVSTRGHAVAKALKHGFVH